MAVATWGPRLRKRAVVIKLDNTVAIAYANRGRGKSTFFTALAHHNLALEASFEINLIATQIRVATSSLPGRILPFLPHYAILYGPVFPPRSPSTPSTRCVTMTAFLPGANVLAAHFTLRLGAISRENTRGGSLRRLCFQWY